MNTPVLPPSDVATRPAGELGALRVAVDTPSHLFNRTVPVEIRDETMALVRRTESGHEIPLPAGLYQVSAVLHDGIECRRIVEVVAGSAAQSVTLVAPAAVPDPGPAGAMSPAEDPPPGPGMPQPTGAPPPSGGGGMRTTSAPRIGRGALPPSIGRNRSYTLSASSDGDGVSVLQRAGGLLKRMKTLMGGAAVKASRRQPQQQQQHQEQEQSVAAGASCAIVELESAAVTGGVPGAWRLHDTGVLKSVATATVRVGSTAWRISLPVGQGDGECLLRVDPGNTRVPVTAWMAPERTMVAALQNMLLRGEYAALVPVAEQAIELLRSKYQDPTGAALGALILHKVGGLAPYASWLENLARDFPWIPDGRVLLASLLVQDHRDLERALEMAVWAASSRMLCTESYSILLDMLRRWPDRAAIRPHRAVVEDIARRGAYVAWGSLFFCHAGQE